MLRWGRTMLSSEIPVFCKEAMSPKIQNPEMPVAEVSQTLVCWVKINKSSVCRIWFHKFQKGDEQPNLLKRKIYKGKVRVTHL
jgi:hypothetical protein